ncbi:DUF935 domain-containing protein [Pendulispora brunnea]|uniref:DUF935 domain-containing protein n=1 Tax=Pendulispora brunnea TaxID=2905690 RepID=A0ABZ2KK54_9BACT
MNRRQRRASARARKGDPPRPEEAPVAPWPLVDRFPAILGSSISLQTISSLFRLSQTGHRQEYVDLLDELLEREPHGYSIVAQRVLNVAGGRLEIVPAPCPPGSADLARAKEIAEEVSTDVKAIGNLREALSSLLWGIYYGVCGAEIGWSREERWRPAWLHFIHSRRLSYPDPATWKVHVWDQGMVRAWRHGAPSESEGSFGLCVEDWPGKFIVHAPQLRADYPTREGLGRQLAFYIALKALGARGGAQYIERFAKPWTLAYAATQADGKPRAANDDDLKQADATVRALGLGSLAGAVLPNSISLQMLGPALTAGRSGITHLEWVELCNNEMTKCVRGQTFTTSPGAYGSRSTATVGQSGELRIAAFDADCLAQTLRRDLIAWMVRLNHPNATHLTPRVVIHVEEQPDASERLDIAKKGSEANLPIDADWLAEELGLRLVPKPAGEEHKPRRMVPIAPLHPVDVQALADPDELLRQQQEEGERSRSEARNRWRPYDNDKARGKPGQ